MIVFYYSFPKRVIKKKRKKIKDVEVQHLCFRPTGLRFIFIYMYNASEPSTAIKHYLNICGLSSLIFNEHCAV